VFALAAAAVPARAHGPLAEQIEALTLAIAARPHDADLYLRRGEIHRLGREWDAARRDYDRAAQLDPAHAATTLCRAALWLDTGDPGAAVQALDTFLAASPDHPEALWLRSRARRTMGQIPAAIADMDRAIALHPNPRPEHYLERAQALGLDDPDHLEDVLRGLDAGIARLGPAASLTAKRSEILATAAERGRDAGALGLADPPANALRRDLRSSAAAPAQPARGATVVRTSALAVTRGPYLQRATPTSVVVRWRTDSPTDSRVRYGDTPTSLVMIQDDATPATEHEVTLTNLTPDTRYYYSIGTSTAVLAGQDSEHWWITPPLSGQPKPTRVWVLGDSGQPGAAQRAVRDAYLAFTGPRITDVWLMLGDNAYVTGTDTEYQVGLFDPYRDLLRKTVLWPTRGNHDSVFAGANNDYYDIFTLPAAGEAGGAVSGTEAYYSFDHGNVHFVCLDSEGSNRSPTGAMLVWLRADLTANDSDWTIAYWHHPPYTKGSHDSDNDSDSAGRMRDMRANALPILDSLGVDLVLTGHSHSYERSFLLDRHYGPSSTLAPWMILDSGSGHPFDAAYFKPTLGPAAHEGAVHAVAGSGSHTSGGPLDHPVMFTSLNVLGSMVLDVDGPRLVARFVDNTGAVRDDFAILKGPGGTPTETGSSVSVQLRLDSARPNPFRDQTRIAYTLPSGGAVRLTIHDAAGRRVTTIVAGERLPGRHVVGWNGRDAHGRQVAAGVYFARLEFEGDSHQGKIVLSH
jgi:hypothetical protein